MSRQLHIGIHSMHCGIRGTTNSSFDYATHIQGILGHKATMIWARNYDNMQHPDMFRMIDESGIPWRKVDNYDDTAELDRVCKDLDLDILYIIKGGGNDGVITKHCPTVIHAVFGPHGDGSKHGSAWAYISEYLSVRHGGSPLTPHVPHIVQLEAENPDRTIRKDWGIPDNARVIGRHGGRTQFDCGHAKTAVDEVLEKADDIWFLFLNTDRFGRAHPRKVFLPASADRQYKTDFVDSCDAMLHARSEGETFGIACGEFSVRNKPIFMMDRQKDWAHLSMLTDKEGDTSCYRYGSHKQLVDQLLAFDPTEDAKKDWSAYRKFSPEHAMELFDKEFIKGVL